MTQPYPYDLGFLDITCEKCGAKDCPLYDGAKAGDWLCEPCKSANEGGDAISWLMESDGITFLEAVTCLAHQRGLPMSEASETEAASWWTPHGWRRLPEPERWRKVKQVDTTNTAWADAMTAIGYRRAHDFNEDEVKNAINVTVWRSDAEAYVELWDISEELTHFFVEEQHLPAFMVDKLPQMIGAFAAVDTAANLAQLNKAIVAFIRHGHGKQTITEDGFRSLDDRAADAVRDAARKRARAPQVKEAQA